MPTLLLRIDAPMQSWGTQSHFSHRDTGREPSKSGIIGLLCAAQGIKRSDTDAIAELSRLRMGVRVDQAGTVRRDYHTAGEGGYYKVSGGLGKNTIPSERFYLADAKFLVGLEGEQQILETLQKSLMHPKWFLFFGRKAFMPCERIWLRNGIQNKNLERALRDYRPWLGIGHAPEQLRLVLEDPNGSIVRNDHIVSFKPRRFLPRRLSQTFIPTPIPEEDNEEQG